MKIFILIAALFFVACSDPPAGPIPKIYSWQDCDEDIKPAAQEAFIDCLEKVGGVYMDNYLEGQQFTPRNCEQYAIALYCIPSAKPNCEKEVLEAVDNCDEACGGEQQKIKSAYEKLQDQFNSCRTREHELSMCAGFGTFMDRCYKKHAAELVEASDDTPHSN